MNTSIDYAIDPENIVVQENSLIVILKDRIVSYNKSHLVSTQLILDTSILKWRLRIVLKIHEHTPVHNYFTLSSGDLDKIRTLSSRLFGDDVPFIESLSSQKTLVINS